MLRQIIKPISEHYDLHIPKEYLNHEVEILVLPFESINKDKLNPEDNEIKAFSNHSANTIDEWLDDSEDDVWIAS
jgi:hypothetical protein